MSIAEPATRYSPATNRPPRDKRRRLSALRRACCVLLIGAAPLAQAALPGPVAQALGDAGIPETAIAVVVQPVTEARPSVAHRSEVAMHPASVMKLITTYAGLEILGPAYNWKTEASTDGKVDNGVLHGNLYIKGYGDPKLTIEQFWLFLKRVQAAGVRAIAGDVVLDTTYFGVVPYNPAEFDDKPNRAYNVGPSALLINYNAVNINLFPDEAAKTVRAWPEPGFAALNVVNHLKLDGGSCGDWKERIALKVNGSGRVRKVEMSGKYAAACGEKNYPLSFFGHQDFARGLFLDLWREMGGKLTGEVRAGAAPATGLSLARLDSPALSEQIRDMNKWSNNVMARQLYLTLGAETAGPPAALEKSWSAVNNWLTGKGLDFAELTVENGSGLSRRERISSQHLADLLLDAWKSPVMPEFISSLPIVAVDGTMKKRLAGDAAAGQAHIKTGTLDGVRAMAGYVRDHNGRTVVVVCLINHARAALGQSAEDALLAWVFAQ